MHQQFRHYLIPHNQIRKCHIFYLQEFLHNLVGEGESVGAIHHYLGRADQGSFEGRRAGGDDSRRRIFQQRRRATEHQLKSRILSHFAI